MATIKYNPLLKRNLQEINDETPFDPSEIESEIADLQQKKVTKFFSATDTLQAGEIAQYQGETDNVNNLVKGYFYTKSETSIVIPSNSPYFKYSTYQPTIIANGYVFRPGDYFAYEIITPAYTSNFYNFSLVYYEGYSKYLFINTTRTVGESVWNKTNHNVVTVTATAPGSITLSDDTIINYSNYTSAPFLKIYNCYSVDCWPYSIITTNMQDIVVHYTFNDDVFVLTDFFSVPVSQFATSSDISLYNYFFSRVDTQPQPSTASTTAAGLMSAADKSKLNGISENANNYSLPIATSSLLGGIKVGANLAISNGVLSGNYSNATTNNDGLMSAEDKTYSTNLQSFGSPKIFSVALYKCILLADITTFWNSPLSTVNLPLQGFVGFAIKFRDGGNISNASADITAMVSYKNDGGSDHKILTTSNSKLTPHIVSYDDKIYITLDYGDIQNHYLKLLGTFHNCLSTPLQVIQSDCTLIE